jgi:hypothetical protein
MTIQHAPETSPVGHRIEETQRPRAYRWAVPAGLVAVAATAVIGVTQYRSDSDDGDRGDFTRSQVLVQDAIDAALTANRSADLTRAQDTVQDAIDEALAANRAGEVTRAQDTVQDAIDEALAANRSPEFTRAQQLVQDAIDAALASS